ncbi:UDP-N-acetylmuramoyl-L-alanine--D-glutamate ligase [Solimonas sp. K1W22B-7]|uniref:UDP-N-acetylmuramoyl-L-alanine--D-glutamate ligase n=1 Tax=Solimonas sp. K1W22B-7 TaxID=2303331 RepID=UPI000E32EF64|nr:UDP-N-acetylmuramoyl-L-alanine--D-glutamate ligase [Solimonas sp. K1W22B-7]AXQ28079.1 UDP-N-acetylmuramoyl-L-alanine--D-glutamate ligase [Solimonas sp. K1W22B-7]
MSRYAGKQILVVGLGASGASALRYLAREGALLTATDSRARPAGLDALRRELPQVQFHCGAFAAPGPIEGYAEAVLSPGVSLDDPFVRELAAAGVPLAGDIELFARAAKAPVIGITGSNGKSTVTTLVGEMALAAGLRAGIGGNLGTPALDLLREDAQLYVLELSSFQLETTQSLSCVAATLLNLSQDHLDRHGTMAHYGAIKARIFDRCGTAVTNREDLTVMALSPPSAISFGANPPLAGHYGLILRDGDTWLSVGDERLLRVSELKIHGLHNAANALAALALADAAGIPREASLRALREFGGLAHRCQFVAEIDGVQYFNDSKGTNVGSTLAALNGLPPGIVWLAGGQGKGQSFSELRPALAIKGRAAILFGEDASRIESDIQGALPVYREPDMLAALARARALAARGDRVLLSPACASFDQFKSYVDRGNQFRAAVEAMK